MSVGELRATGSTTDVRLVAVGIRLGARSACHKVDRNHDQQDQRQKLKKRIAFHGSVPDRLIAFASSRTKGYQVADINLAPAARRFAGSNSAPFHDQHNDGDNANHPKSYYGHHFLTHRMSFTESFNIIQRFDTKSDDAQTGACPC